MSNVPNETDGTPTRNGNGVTATLPPVRPRGPVGEPPHVPSPAHLVQFMGHAYRSALVVAKTVAESQLRTYDTTGTFYAIPSFDHGTTFDGSACISVPNPLPGDGSNITITFTLGVYQFGWPRNAHLVLSWGLPDRPEVGLKPMVLGVGSSHGNQTVSETISPWNANGTKFTVNTTLTRATLLAWAPGLKFPARVSILAQAVGEATLFAGEYSNLGDTNPTDSLNAQTIVTFPA